MLTFSYETEGALQGHQNRGVTEGQCVKGRGRKELYYPHIVLFITGFYIQLHISGQKMKNG